MTAIPRVFGLVIGARVAALATFATRLGASPAARAEDIGVSGYKALNARFERALAAFTAERLGLTLKFPDLWNQPRP